MVAHFLGDNSVVKRLADVRAPFFGPTSSLTLDSERVAAANIHLAPLAQAEKGYWGETDYNSDDETLLQFDSTKDKGDPLTIAASIEKGGSAMNGSRSTRPASSSSEIPLSFRTTRSLRTSRVSILSRPA